MTLASTQKTGALLRSTGNVSHLPGATPAGAPPSGVSFADTTPVGAPPRPMLPILLGPLAAIWMGISLAEQLIWNRCSPASWVVILSVIAAALVYWQAAPEKSLRWLRLTRLKRRLTSVISTRKNLSLSQKALVTLLVLLASLLWGLCFYQRLNSMRAAVETDLSAQIEARVISDPQLGGVSSASIVEFRLPGGAKVRCRFFWPGKSSAPAYGATVVVRGSFIPLHDYQEFLFRQGVIGSFAVSSIESVSFKSDFFGVVAGFRQGNRELLLGSAFPLMSVTSQPTSAASPQQSTRSALLLTGILLGDASELNVSHTGDTFRTTGLSHLIAVSGSHLAIIATMLAWLLKKLGISTRAEVISQIAFVCIYAILTALQPSALRSVGMLAILQSTRLVGRRSHSPSALCITACLMLLVHPPVAFSLGFWLSVFAVFGIAIFQPLVSVWVDSAAQAAAGRLASNGVFSRLLAKTHLQKPAAHVSKRIQHLIKDQITDPVALGITAQACTLPLTASAFTSISLIALPANLIVTPLITLILMIGLPSLLVGGVAPRLLSHVIPVLATFSEIACILAESLARLPWAAVPFDAQTAFCLVSAIGVGAIIYRLWPQPTRRNRRAFRRVVLALLLVCASVVIAPRPPEMVMLDIGQGDAILIREGSANLLLDTGSDTNTLRRAMARNHVVSLSALVLSHLDSDHCGAIAALSGTIRPQCIYFASGLRENRAQAAAITDATLLVGSDSVNSLTAGDTLVLSRHFRLTVLLPLRPAYHGDNEESLVLSLDYDADTDGVADIRVLLTGDAESDILARLLYEYPDLTFPVMKVAHHGSKNSVNAELLYAWDCKVALISVGNDNRYGHPATQTLDRLAEYGVQIYRTDELGDIHLSFNARGLTISYSESNPFWSH